MQLNFLVRVTKSPVFKGDRWYADMGGFVVWQNERDKASAWSRPEANKVLRFLRNGHGKDWEFGIVREPAVSPTTN